MGEQRLNLTLRQNEVGNLGRTVFSISLGAVTGALCRYYLGIWFFQQFGSTFPYGTMFVNITGCFLMGFFLAFAQLPSVPIDPQIRLMVTTGCLGSYTTFSSYELDTAKLLNHSLETALLYWAGTVLLGFGGLRLGDALAHWLRPQRQD